MARRADLFSVQEHVGEESDFDELAAAAAAIAETPIALVSLIRGQCYWYRGAVGYDQRLAPRQGSFCDEVADGHAEFEIADATAEPRFASNPLVTGEPFVRAYAGFPLVLSSGELVGTLCVVDTRPRALRDEQKALLRVLARQAVAQYELRRRVAQLDAATQELERVQERYSQLAVHQLAEAQAMAKLGSWDWDFVAQRVIWSPEMFRIFGLPPDAVVPTGTAFLQLVHPSAREDFWALANRLLRSGGRASHHIRTLGADGVERFVEGWGEVELDAATGRPRRAFGTLQDITEQVEREMALAESEQRLRLTIENSPIGVAIVGLDGSWQHINDALVEILGYSRAELTGRTFQDITHPDDLEVDLGLLQQLLDGTRDSYRLEKRYRHAAGHTVWVNLTASVVRKADGTPLHYLSQIEDITARREATAELEAERDFSAALLASLHDGYAYLERGQIVVVNEAFCRMTGYERRELIGSGAAFLLADSGDPGSGFRMADLINDRNEHVELTIRRRDLSTFDALVQLTPVRRPDARINGYVALVRDITERKTYERRLRHLADHDELTGLLNRAAFHVRLRERVAAAYASASALSLAVIDLDRFKHVNDTYGHPAGDAVLAEFADRLRGNARGDDVVGRLGGEEFGLLMSATDLDEALAAVGRTLDAVRRHTFPHVERLTFSAGVAELQPAPGPGDGPDACSVLLQRADRALYAAKSAGRNRVLADGGPLGRLSSTA